VGKSLKDENKKALWTVVTLNLAFFALVLRGDALQAPSLPTLIEAWAGAWPMGLAVVGTTVLNALLPPEHKARLVFLRWRHALPGARAFTVHASADPRVDVDGLKRVLGGAFPSGPDEENRAWYKLYKSVQSEAAVEHVHREFLFLRDYAALAALVLAILGSVGFLMAHTWTVAAGYACLALIQYVIVRQAAENAGVRVVRTVLAQVSTP
jgi:anti-sigma factor ChrR (cupin superfamily)